MNLPIAPSRLLVIAAALVVGALVVAPGISQGKCAAAERLLGTARAEASQAPPPVRGIRAEGRVVAYPGAVVLVGTELSGRLATLAEEGRAVKRGEVIATLDAAEQEAALQEARARVAEADADIRLARSERDRAAQLARASVGTPQGLDRAERDLDAATARRATLAATVARLQASLAKATIAAPIDGVVVARHAEAGETVPAGAPLLKVADLSRRRVVAEIDEIDLGRITLGAGAVLTAEGFEGERWEAVIEEIPYEVVPRGLDPRNPAQPTDTQVLLVKMAIRGDSPLKLGQRVDVAIALGS